MLIVGTTLVVAALMGVTVTVTTGPVWWSPYFLGAGLAGVVLAVIGRVRGRYR